MGTMEAAASVKPWGQAFKDGLISGSIASAASTAVLSVRGEREADTPYAPTNATSQWVYGEQAAYHDEPSLRHTVIGYGIHHASVTLWAVIYEKWFGKHAERTDASSLGKATAGAAMIAAMACFVDYRLTPRRLRPGFEKRLSRASLFMTYASFGAGLLVRGLTTAGAGSRGNAASGADHRRG
ncbi:hypothetical protein [Noviherbaspirillum aerium]|uniref:hypothetical protein n=1 Tax=Noviherbaspirillum aerium TaxID=2588497 RepID=UPI00178C7BED|nr:hypothetical protein [Noviherbaspirillum aerium]